MFDLDDTLFLQPDHSNRFGGEIKKLSYAEGKTNKVLFLTARFFQQEAHSQLKKLKLDRDYSWLGDTKFNFHDN